MTENDFVGMSDCFFCGQPKELLLDRRLKKSIPKNAVYNMEPCEKCKGYMKQGIIIIGVKDGETDTKNPYRTGLFCVVKEDWAHGMLKEPMLSEVLKKRVLFMENKIAEQIGLNKAAAKADKNAKAD